MDQKCNYATRIVLRAVPVALAIGLAACGTEESRNPLSPNIAGEIAGVNITIPALIEPINGVLVVSGTPVVLKFGSATSNSERPFWYEVQLARDDTFQQIVRESTQVAPEESGTQALAQGVTNSFPVEETLESGVTYWWRVRAADGANTGPYSEAHAFEVYTPVTVGVPVPKSPVGGVVLTSPQPQLNTTTPEITGPATNIRVRFEIATSTSFANPTAVLEVAPGAERTLVTSGNLAWNTTFYWRVRVAANGREGQIVGNWSQTVNFKTPPAPALPPPPPPDRDPQPDPSPTGPAPAPSCCPPPNRFDVMKQVAAQTGYPNSGISVHDFTQKVAERLVREDANWGRYINTNGNLGFDILAYRINGQNQKPYKIDIVLGANTSGAKIHWLQEGIGNGTWKSVN